MSRAHRGEAPGRGSHYRLECVSPIGALLLQIGTEGGEVFVAERLRQQYAIGFGTGPGGCAWRVLGRVQREHRVLALAAECRAAQPGKARRIVGDTGTDRVEVDVANAAQQVGVIVDQAGLAAAFPQGACAAVAGIELANVLAAELLHEGGDGARLRRRDEQVHVVVHQHVGMQLAAGGEQRFAQQVAIADAVGIVEEAGQAVVAALDDVLRDAGQVESGLASHARSVAARRPAA